MAIIEVRTSPQLRGSDRTATIAWKRKLMELAVGWGVSKGEPRFYKGREDENLGNDEHGIEARKGVPSWKQTEEAWLLGGAVAEEETRKWAAFPCVHSWAIGLTSSSPRELGAFIQIPAPGSACPGHKDIKPMLNGTAEFGQDPRGC